MAFKKCTSVEAWWKVRGQNLESVRLTIYEKQYFTPVLICSNLVKTFHIVPTCSHLFTPVHTCSHLFTPVHTSVTFSAVPAMAVSRRSLPLLKLLFFDPTSKTCCSDSVRAGTIECHNFFVLGPILVKFHIRTHLIEGFPTTFRT